MNEAFDRKFGENIRRIRTAEGLTQEQLATGFQLRGCGITRSAVAKIEVAQRHIYPDEIVILRSLLDVGYDELFEFRQE